MFTTRRTDPLVHPSSLRLAVMLVAVAAMPHAVAAVSAPQQRLVALPPLADVRSRWPPLIPLTSIVSSAMKWARKLTFWRNFLPLWDSISRKELMVYYSEGGWHLWGLGWQVSGWLTSQRGLASMGVASEKGEPFIGDKSDMGWPGNIGSSRTRKGLLIVLDIDSVSCYWAGQIAHRIKDED